MWEKMVLNLLSNALKFTFDGAVTVRVARATDAAANVSVTDTGIGIPAAEMPQLFDRFHRIEAARARSTEGTGIGLALVQELVGLHGGTSAADSRRAPARRSLSACRSVRRTCRPTSSSPAPAPARCPASIAGPYRRRKRCAGCPSRTTGTTAGAATAGVSPAAGDADAGPRPCRRRQRRHARIPDRSSSRRRLRGQRGRRRPAGAGGIRAEPPTWSSPTS